MKKAVLYLRYSSAGQSEQSIEGQRAVCQRYAESNDITGSTTFECSPSVPNGPPFEMDTNTMKVVLDEMVIVAQYTLYFS